VQGRSFRLKSGVPIQKENEVLLGPEVRGGEWGGGIPISFNYGVWESVVSTPSSVRGRAPAENGFIVI